MGNQREKWRLTIVLTMLLLGMALGGCADREILVYGQSAADSQERFLCAERPLPEEEADQPRLYESNGKILQNGISKRGRTAMGIIFCSWNQWRSPESRLQLQRASKAENFLDVCLTDATGTEVRRLQ